MTKTNLCVSYELGLGAKREYADLFAALAIFEDRCHALETLWFLSTPWSARQVYEHLRRHMDPADSLMVEEMPARAGWSGWVDQGVRDWLTEHLGPPV